MYHCILFECLNAKKRQINVYLCSTIFAFSPPFCYINKSVQLFLKMRLNQRNQALTDSVQCETIRLNQDLNDLDVLKYIFLYF